MSCILHTWVTWVLNIFCIMISNPKNPKKQIKKSDRWTCLCLRLKKQCHDMSEYLHDDPKHPKKHPWPGTINISSILGYLLYLHLFTSKESTIFINYQFGFTQHLWMIFPHFPAMGCSSHGSSYRRVDDPRLPVATSRPYWDAAAAPGTEVLPSQGSTGGVLICVYLYGSFHYPLVNSHITIENHHFQWLNQL